MQQAGAGSQGGGGPVAVYRGLRGRRAMSVMGEINVVPLVDVVLVLLLVFMVTAPMMSRSIDVALPVADQPRIEPEDQLTVTINAQQQVFIGDRPVNLLLLEDRLRAMLEGRLSKVVMLKADEGLRYGKVVEVMDKMMRAGVEQIGFAYVLPQERARR